MPDEKTESKEVTERRKRVQWLPDEATYTPPANSNTTQ